MSVHDGILRKTWEVHCRLCESPALGLRGEKPSAAEQLRSMGWETRMGIWICGVCSCHCPRGAKLNTPDDTILGDGCE